MGISIFFILLAVFVVGFIFIKTSPEFGSNPTDEDKVIYEKSPNFENGLFKNLIQTDMDMSFKDMMKLTGKFFSKIENAKPDFELPLEKTDSVQLKNGEISKLIWFGHSAFFLRLDDKNILIDPMLGKVPAPHPTLGRNRYSKELPIEIEAMPSIDIVMISHDHYDHLDYGSIKKLIPKTKLFLVPLGVKAHLTRWGVAENKVQEFDWWDSDEVAGIQITFAPSRHFSGRGLNNRFSTLWGSWIIKGESHNIYFSGDGGYGPHFKEIGDKYGPFDLAMMECGQYNELWSDIHMMPEETAIAGRDVRAKIVMPIHWGAFTLALHSWTDPVERLMVKANEIDLPLLIPTIGEEIKIGETSYDLQEWWTPKSLGLNN